MSRIAEIKNQARITIDNSLGLAQAERGMSLKFQIDGLINEAYEAGQNDTFQKVMSQGRTFGGHK